MALITRQEKGSKLTIQEMDGNLLGLDTGKFQGDKFRQLLLDNILDESEPLSESEFYTGAEKVDGLLGGNPTQIFDIIEEEDFEALKAPLVKDEPTYLIYSGTRVGSVEKGRVFINGILFPQGGDFSGAGSVQLINTLNEEEPFYAESVDLNLFAWKYGYGYNSEEEAHFHYIELRLPLFGLPFVVITVDIDDDADSWEDVNIQFEGLAPQG
jgi:hypothetical protein